MELRAIDEYSEKGHLIFAADYAGAFARGKTRREALQKLPADVGAYCAWVGLLPPDAASTITIIQEKASDLDIADADSDILWADELPPLDVPAYRRLKALALRSARDFERLYQSLPDQTAAARPPRRTFYGAVPRTGEEMYRHVLQVNDYYFGEIGVEADNEGGVYACRLRGFEALEKQSDYLSNARFEGSYGESWTLRKVCRRFIWHDRIHAKAMHRMALCLWGPGRTENPFYFSAP